MLVDLHEFSQQIQQRKEYIDNCLENLLKKEDTYPPVIHQAMRYAVFNGGKRLRPIMVLEGHRLAGGNPESVSTIACAMEMIHSYSLVHDDLPVMDDDDYRRGQLTCHRVFGEATAILTGDALLTEAFVLMSGSTDLAAQNPLRLLQVIREIAQAAGSEGMIGGQLIDLDAENKAINREELEGLHSLKTGALFKASLRAGAILGEMDDQGLTALGQYAHHFGLAFQITDDILDVDGDQFVLGKPVGSDAKNMKSTYTSLFGLDGARQLARQCVDRCHDSLAGFGTEADFLRDLATFTLHRTV
ncbi:Terpenoid synthase [Syntrophomonas zehnderi OL-4]|uniref:Farnesyl diphosphate synthase n=1 Tax=Syntrophomonas zehnderi OL-4 TaxID=690567 RepID=A0A0E4GAH1_9FIRM|nr:farnesyl diphosphate synthase [Syntrophomonas zehnderi]CFX49824.1 Terpenoid synthase [Syntrophomonas zehnderi OL-4]